MKAMSERAKQDKAAYQQAHATAQPRFDPGSREAFANAIAKVFAVFSERSLWRQMQRNAMRHPVGWDGPAERYIDLYARLMAATEGKKRFSGTR